MGVDALEALGYAVGAAETCGELLGILVMGMSRSYRCGSILTMDVLGEMVGELTLLDDGVQVGEFFQLGD